MFSILVERIAGKEPGSSFNKDNTNAITIIIIIIIIITKIQSNDKHTIIIIMINHLYVQYIGGEGR
jgi:hypothetical protein